MLIAGQVLDTGLDVTPGWAVSVVFVGANQEALRSRFVPEPGTGLLLLSGILGLAWQRRGSDSG